MSSTSKNSKLKRYQLTIFATLFIGYACYAYNRKSVSLAMPKLIEEGLDKSDAGLIVSSQNVAYAMSKFVGGILSDRISSRLLFSSGLLLSGLATLLFSSSDSITLFTLLWFLNGLAQGAGWPSCAKLLRQWYSPAQFGTFWSLLSASSNIAGTFSPFFSAFMILNYGWRFSLIVAGSISIAIGVLALIAVVNSPKDIGLKSFAETISKKDDNNRSNQKETVGDLVRSPFLWLIAFCYFSVFYVKTSAVDWGQLYLIQDRKQTPFVGSAFVSSLELGGFVGGIIAGYLTDIALRRHAKSNTKSQGNPRMPVAILFMIVVAASLHLLHFNVTPETSQIFISLIGFIHGAGLYGPIAIYGVVATESAPAHLSGTSHAIVALAANIGAITSGLPFSYIAKQYNWATIFLLLEGLAAATVVIMVLTRKMSSSIGRIKQKTQ